MTSSPKGQDQRHSAGTGAQGLINRNCRDECDAPCPQAVGLAGGARPLDTGGGGVLDLLLVQGFHDAPAPRERGEGCLRWAPLRLRLRVRVPGPRTPMLTLLGGPLTLGGELERHVEGSGASMIEKSARRFSFPTRVGLGHAAGTDRSSSASPTSRASVGCILRAPSRPVDLDRDALGVGSRFDQVKR
jgi:hypothetical protein